VREKWVTFHFWNSLSEEQGERAGNLVLYLG
jgi:hypothetical protein